MNQKKWNLLYDAFRSAGFAHRQQWKEKQLSKGRPICPLSVKPLNAENSLVYHEPPFTLQQLIFLFLSDSGLTREDVEIGDGGLVCENLRARWLVHYKARARLRLVHRDSNYGWSDGSGGWVHWASLHKGSSSVVGLDRMERLEEAGLVGRLECRVASWGRDRNPIGWYVPDVILDRALGDLRSRDPRSLGVSA